MTQHQSHTVVRALRAGALCCALAACSPQTDVGQPEDVLDFNTEVSEADLRTARLLSLSNNGSLQTISDPYELSISCVVSIETLADRLREMSAVTPEQLSAIGAAVAVYRQRGLDTGKSPAELDRDIEERRAEEADISQQGRMALSCLRQFA